MDEKNISNRKDIVYFELNNWSPGTCYPNEEPFISWMKNDLFISFNNEEWIKENRLCVVREVIDMSFNFCISATTKWVMEYCPKLLFKYTEFLRYKNESGIVYGNFGTEFLEYKEENIGIKDVEKDEDN